jgi:transposase
MEGNPLHRLSVDDLAGLVLRLRGRLESQARRIAELERELEEHRKQNPTQRLDEAYSLMAEEKRRDDAQRGGKSGTKRQKSKRRGRISTAEKLAAATIREDIWPSAYKLSECKLRYSRVAWRIKDGQAVRNHSRPGMC